MLFALSTVGVLLLGGGGYLLYGILFKVNTADGTLVIEVDDPKNVVVEIDGSKARIKPTADGKAVEISVEPGTKKLVVKTANGLMYKTSGRKVEIEAGKMKRIKAWLEPENVIAGSGDKKPGRSFALRFDGKDDYVEIPTLKGPANTPCTIEAWVTPFNRGPGVPTVIALGGLRIRLAQSGAPQWMFNAVGTGKPLMLGGPRANVSERTHIAGVFDRHLVRLFVNGKLLSRVVVEKGWELRERKPLAYVGGFGKEDPAAAFFGVIHQLHVSNSALYTQEFTPPQQFVKNDSTRALFDGRVDQGGKLVDASGNGHHGKIHGATPLRTPFDVDRNAAEWVHSAGGGIKVRVGDRLVSVGTGDEVPAGDLRLEWVDLSSAKNVNDETIRVLVGCRHLQQIYLNNNSGITDAGMHLIKNFPALKFLDLSNTKVTDDALGWLVPCKKLEVLHLDGTAITDDAVPTLLRLPLASLKVQFTGVSRDGIRKLIAGLPRCRIEYTTGRKALPKCRIDSDQD